MIVVIFGPAGSGKGTQAAMIAKNLGLKHFSMGDALREEIKSNTAIGKQIKPIVNSGKLVPAGITNNIILNAYKNNPKGLVFDGYPRNAEQMEFVKKNFKIDYAIELQVSDAEVINRMSTRRICPKCGRNYNIISLKPKVTGICDDCKTKIVQRDDDKPDEISKRLQIYRNETLPLKKYYTQLKVLHIIDATGSIADVNKAIMNLFNVKKSKK